MTDANGDTVLLVGGGSELVVFPQGDLLYPLIKRIESDSGTKRNCERAGIANRTHCKNFIRNIVQCNDEDEIVFCGTNAFKPKLYSVNLRELVGNNSRYSEQSGTGVCPSSPMTSRQANKYGAKN